MTRDSRRRNAIIMAKRVKPLALLASDIEHGEESQARAVLRAQAIARIQEMLPPTPTTRASSKPPLPALLIINSKSGPNHDSLLRVGELVDLLASHNIVADVRVKLHKSQARREARSAAKAGYRLVVAAGGDGTVAAVSRGLVGSETVLGIIPLGTYNNIATSLGIPTDAAQACALIAAAPVRAIDVGEVRARGMKRARVFLELGAVGIAAPLAIAGQGLEKGRWADVSKHLPQAVEMTPTMLGIRVDRQQSAHPRESLLAIVANTPLAGAGLVMAPQAKLDDGLLDVKVYEGMSQPALAAHFLAVKTGTVGDDPRVRSSTGRKVVIRSATPLPVVVDSKVVGRTPVRFRVLAGGLLVIAGNGDGLARPAAQSLLSAINEHASAPLQGVAQTTEVVVRAQAAQSNGLLLSRLRAPLAIAVTTGAAIGLLPAMSRWIGRHRR
jgi:diacylglycerol kinase (ATP)